jgi:hypothetical protein
MTFMIIRAAARGLKSLVCAAAFACLGMGAAHANAVTEWNNITVRYVSGGSGITAGRPGPVGFLDVALVQVAVHDAVQTIEGRYQRYHYKGSGAGNSDAAVAAATHRMLLLLYPSQSGTLNPLYDTYIANHGLTGDSGIAVGEAAAYDLYAEYRPLITVPVPFMGTAAPGEWRSATPMSFEFLGLSKPYLLNSVTQFRPGPPPPMQSTDWVRQFNETKAVGSAANYPGANSAVADFWNFDPLKMWNGAIRGLMVSEDNSDSAKLFASANLATADTLMSVFEAKRHYHFWRPITAIRNEDGNPRTATDASWTPYVTTPNYPEYPSGANGVAGAMVGTLTLFYGTDEVNFSIPGATVSRNYSSFSEAGKEIVEVRILQGIHFREAEDESSRLGQRVAHWGWQKFLGGTVGAPEGAPVPWIVENVRAP